MGESKSIRLVNKPVLAVSNDLLALFNVNEVVPGNGEQWRVTGHGAVTAQTAILDVPARSSCFDDPDGGGRGAPDASGWHNDVRGRTQLLQDIFGHQATGQYRASSFRGLAERILFRREQNLKAPEQLLRAFRPERCARLAR